VDIEHFAPLCINSAEMEIEGPGDDGYEEIAALPFDYHFVSAQGELAMTEQRVF
jgi:hypothetical protein